MKILLLVIGKTDENRKSLSESQQKKQEGILIISKLKAGDKLILLDDKGKDFSSLGFSEHLQQQMNSGIKRLVFVVGGPYGFDESVYAKAQAKLSLSKMTFSHQMIRLFFVEQVYRALTILKNEPYHHE